MNVSQYRCLNEKRATPLNSKASDFIVKSVLKNESILLRHQSERFLSSNERRKEIWKAISKEVFDKFDIALTPKQVQQHFNNKKRKALSLEPREKKYRKETGAGNFAEEPVAVEEAISKAAFELQSYYDQKIATQGPSEDALNQEIMKSGPQGNESSTCTSSTIDQINDTVDSDKSTKEEDKSESRLDEKLNKIVECFQTMTQEQTRMCRAFIQLAELQKKSLESIIDYTKLHNLKEDIRRYHFDPDRPVLLKSKKKRVIIEDSSVTKEDVMIQKIEDVEDEVEEIEEA